MISELTTRLSIQKLQILLNVFKQWTHESNLCRHEHSSLLQSLDDLIKRELVEKEKKALAGVFKALHSEFGHAQSFGRFYLCPNGHPYVIGNCGGAVMTATCSECGAQIGGGSHVLLSTNSRTTGQDLLTRLTQNLDNMHV
ncbi:hypothetical protein GEMRC1_008245 [Eukaryota sp. GEM-RC1]